MNITLDHLPSNVEDLRSMPQAALLRPEDTAALTVAVLCHYRHNVEETHAMLNFLKGPESLSPYEKQFLRERLDGRDYIPFSFLQGAVPANGYTPSTPYVVTADSNMYSQTDENHMTLWLACGGADNSRSVSFRRKPSTGQWFLSDGFGFLAGIRIPENEDPWA